MSFVLADRVSEGTITSGTSSPVGLAGANTGYQTWAAIGNGNTSFYCMVAPSGEWEVGICTYSSSGGGSLTRTAGNVLAGSAGAGVLTFFPTGGKTVFCVVPASKALYADDIGDIKFRQNSVVPFTSVNSGALVNTLYLNAGKVGIGNAAPGQALHVTKAGTGPVIVAEFESSDGVATTSEGRIVFGNGGNWFTGIAGAYNNGNPYLELSASSAGNAWAGKMRLLSDGNIVIGTAAIATNATAGFPWIPSCAGTPTGAPTSPYTNAAALIVDTTGSKLWARVGTTWKSVGLV